jgi:hypothetical protein
MSDTPEPTPSVPPGIEPSLQRLTVELYDARIRARALADSLEETWRAHVAAGREAERLGLLPKLD